MYKHTHIVSAKVGCKVALMYTYTYRPFWARPVYIHTHTHISIYIFTDQYMYIHKCIYIYIHILI